MPVRDNLATAKAIYNNFNNRKIEDSVQFLSDDFVSTNVPMNIEFKGKEGFLQAMNLWPSAFPDARVEIKNMVDGGDYVVTEFTGVGTHNGVMETPMGKIGPTGKKVTIPFCEVSRFQNGKCVSSHLYFDVVTIMSQLEVSEQRM